MRYIIEIKPEYEDSFKGLMILGAKDNDLFVDTLAVDDLELLNSDYINEHFGELQDEAYQRGLDDAWQAARKIVGYTDHGGLTVDALGEVFGTSSYSCIVRDNTAQEAIDKIKAYEEKQKAADDIKVGDEVFSKNSEAKGILLEPETEDVLATIIVPSQRWRTIHDSHDNLEKTGKHYDIEKFLEEMKE